MKKTITVLICDDDQFYLAGLKCFLQSWFQPHGITVNVSTNFQQRACADVLFIALSELSPYRLYALRQEMKSNSSPVFVIGGYGDESLNCSRERVQMIGTDIHRNSTLAALGEKFYDIIHRMESPPAPSRSASSHISLLYRLTFRETQILRYLARGISHAMVARYLHISEKTVSAHKRNIMVKLNLSRTTELNYWLIKEGFFAKQKLSQAQLGKR